jgi:hypothetical protein
MPRRDGDVFLFGTAMDGLLASLEPAAGAEIRLSMEAGLIMDAKAGG